jgi:CelD/BcsL family acetyltransferase involved in cellulose biosynthesis
MGFTATFPGKSPEVSSAGGNISLWVARTVAEVEELRGIWQAWQDQPGSVIDAYLDWFKEDPTSRPHVLVVHRDGSPDCLLIGKHLRKAVISRVARLLHSDARVLYFVQGGLLGNASAENCEFLVRAVLAQLRAGEASAAEFFGLPTDSPLYRAAMRVPAFFCRDHFPATTIHRYLVLPDSFQEFLNNLPAKERQNIKYRHKRLIKKFSGKVRLSRFWEEDDVQALVSAAEEIAKKTYQRAFGRGFTLAEAAGLRGEARTGSLRAYILYIEENPCAFLIARWHRGILYGTYAGHDPKYAEYSLGRYLLMCCIEDCFLRNNGERTLIIDPGVGDQPYKRLFTNSERLDAHVAVYAPTLTGFLRSVARIISCAGFYSAKAVLQKSNLLPAIRKIRRNQVVRKSRQNHEGQREKPEGNSYDESA